MFGKLGILRIFLTWNIFNPRWVYPFIVSVQLVSRVWLFSTPWTAARQASLSFTSSWSLLNSTPLSQWCYPPNLSFALSNLSNFSLLPSVFPSIRVFSNESALRIRWPNYWSFSFSISPSDQYSGLISFQSVQSLSRVWLFVTPWTAARQASLSITNSQSPSNPMSIESVMPSNHLILCRPRLLLPPIFPSIRVFSNDSALWIIFPLGLTGLISLQIHLLTHLLGHHKELDTFHNPSLNQERSVYTLLWLTIYNIKFIILIISKVYISGIKYIQNIVQTSPPSISTDFSPSQLETLYPLNNNSHFLSSPSSW